MINQNLKDLKNQRMVLWKLLLHSICSLAMLVFILSPAKAEKLANDAIFKKCYSQITGKFCPNNHPQLLKVRNNGLDPITACMDVLKKAKLAGTTTGNFSVRLSDTSREAKDILDNFHKLHWSWMSVRTFNKEYSYSRMTRNTKDIYGDSTPALYITRSLFDSTMPVSEIFTSTKSFMPIRTNMNPSKGPWSLMDKSTWDHEGNIEFVPTGDLLGVRARGAMSVKIKGNPNYKNYYQNGRTVDIFKHNGGGVLSFPPYIRYTVKEGLNFTASAGPSMPRRWAISFANDFLCRTMPMVRDQDVIASKLVDPAAEITFRKSTGCVRCHITMDRMSATIRNVTFTAHSSDAPNRGGGTFTDYYPTNMAAESEWPKSVDKYYANRPPSGHLYMRSFNGSLIDRKVNNVAGLGLEVSKIDDPYICLAKRYFRHFVGN